jgi:hypothetical protein
MRLKLTPASELPAPGQAAVEVLACDLRSSDGRRAIRRSCGKHVLQELLGRRARYVTVAMGAGGRVVVPYSEAEFPELGANLIDCVRFAPGPIVLSPFGLRPEMREKLLEGARRRDLETAEPAGSA